jgi:hypothetical protein
MFNTVDDLKPLCQRRTDAVLARNVSLTMSCDVVIEFF